ncbi:membrane protein [Acidobacteria bacterium Mor1]|nr:membrane protein [Acidobacteria bacterium Mor1]
MSDPIFLLLLVGLPVISQMVAGRLRARFARFSRDPMPLSGREVAERMLAENGLTDVKIISTGGQLTDHYNPRDKTVNLSEVVYSRSNVAAAAVAAHECGHAIQHATRYPFLTARSKLVPLLKLSNTVLPLLAFGGSGLFAYMGSSLLAYGFIGILAMPALFSLVTLPVEFDASRRALDWMEGTGLAAGAKQAGAKNALFWAAMTYVVAALGSIAQVLYFARFFLRRR